MKRTKIIDVAGLAKYRSFWSHFILTLIFITNTASSQPANTEQHVQRLQDLRAAASVEYLTRDFESFAKQLKTEEQNLENLKHLSLEHGTHQAWPQTWQKFALEADRTSKKIEDLKFRVHQNLTVIDPNLKSSSRKVLTNLDSKLESLIKSRSQFFVHRSQLSLSLSALDLARYTAGSLRLDRMRNLYQDQLDKLYYPDDSLSPSVVAANDWIASMQMIDPGLMTTGNLYDSYCVASILETYPIVNELQPSSLEHMQQTQLVQEMQQANHMLNARPKPPKDFLTPIETPMQRLSRDCLLMRPNLQSKRDANPWLQSFPLQGNATLNLVTGQTVDCDAVSKNFQAFIVGYEEGSNLIQRMIALLEDFASSPIADEQFHAAYDPLEQSYNNLQDRLTKLYPDEYFERNHSLQLIWPVKKPSNNARFIPWLVEFGPESWNGFWQSLVTEQDWYQSGPNYSSAQQAMLYSFKASIHDVCVDRRSVRIFGFWADDECSGGDCLFLQPGLSLQAGG